MIYEPLEAKVRMQIALQGAMKPLYGSGNLARGTAHRKWDCACNKWCRVALNVTKIPNRPGSTKTKAEVLNLLIHTQEGRARRRLV